MASFYEPSNKEAKITVRLTPHQLSKIKHTCELFGISYQRFLADSVDYFYMNYLEVQSGRIAFSPALRESMLKMLDEYVQTHVGRYTKPPFILNNPSKQVPDR